MLDHIAKVNDNLDSLRQYQKYHANKLQDSKEDNTYVNYDFVNNKWKAPNCSRSECEENLKFSKIVLTIIKHLVSQRL